MPIAPNVARRMLINAGLNPDEYELSSDGTTPIRKVTAQPAITDNGRPQPKIDPMPGDIKPMGAGATFIKEAIHSAPAAAAGGLAAGVTWPIAAALAPETGGLSLAIPAVASLASAFFAGNKVSQWQGEAESAYAPDYVAQRESNIQAHPTAGMVGRLGALTAGGMNPNLPNVGKAAGSVIARLSGAQSKLNPADLANLANVGIGAGLGTGIAAGQQLYQGKSLGEVATSPDTLEALLGGAIFNKPNPIGRNLGFHDVPQGMEHALDVAPPEAPALPATKVPTPLEQALLLSQKRDAGLNPLKLLNAVSSHTAPIVKETKTGVKLAPMLGEREPAILSAEEAAAQKNSVSAREAEDLRAKQAGILRDQEAQVAEAQRIERAQRDELMKRQRAIDFQRAQAELDAQEAAIAQQKAAAKQAKESAHMQMKLGVNATPEAIMGRSLDRPEIRRKSSPGLAKRVDAMEAEPINPVQDEADIIQERLERKNQEPEDATIATELRQKVAENTRVPEVTDFAKSLLDEQARARGIDVGTTEERGSFALLADKLKRMAAKIGTKEGMDTRAHEFIGHIFNKMLELSPYASDKRIQRQMLDAAAKSSELKAINEARAKVGKLPLGLVPEDLTTLTPEQQARKSAEEFVANQQGLHWLISGKHASGESANTQWFKNWKAQMKSVLGRATPEDLRRIVDYKWHNDAPFNEYFGVQAGAGTSGTRVNMSPDEGFNTKEGDDVLSSNEDIKVVDKTKPLPDAIARAKELGYTYDGLQEFAPGFKFHAFTRRDDAVGAPGRGATFYVNEAQGNKTAIEAAALKKNADFGVTRVNQPEGENFNPAETIKQKAEASLADYRELNKDVADAGIKVQKFLSLRIAEIGINPHDRFNALQMSGNVLEGIDSRPEAVEWVRTHVYQGDDSRMLNDMLAVQRHANYLDTLKAKADSKRQEVSANEVYSSRLNQPADEALTPEQQKREARLAQMKARDAKAAAEHKALREAAGDTQNLVNKEGNPNIKDVKRPINTIPKRLTVSIDKPTAEGTTIGDLIPDKNAAVPGESVVTDTGTESLDERIARKTNEQLQKLAETTPDSEAAQTVGKHVASEEVVHAAELDMSYAHMGDIVEQRIKELNDDLKLAQEEGINTSGIEDALDKQQKMLEFIKTKDPAAKVDLKNLTKVYQPEEESIKRPFMTSSERILKPIKGFMDIQQILNTLRNKVPPAEWSMLKNLGIESAFGPGARVSGQELTKWIQENGPRAEVHTYGMEGKVSEAKREYDKMTHEWLDALPQNKLQEYYKVEMNDTAIALRELKQKGWEQKDLDNLSKYRNLKHQVSIERINSVYDTSPRATSYYNTVSALPTNEPMPEWTATKSGNNVQRVDVVVPQKKVPITYEDYLAQTARKDGEGSRAAYQRDMQRDNPSHNTKDLWQPDNLHENLPNTLGWAMIQYKTGPNGEKIAVIAEAQSRWGQEVRKYWDTYAKEKKRLLDDPAQYSHVNKDMAEHLADREAHNVARSKVNQYRPGMDHPLEKDYNRLILKAAIEQARKEGATHIMVSDAETAMMTEGHDLQTATQTKLASDKATLEKLAQDKGYTVTKGPYEKSNGLWEIQYTERPTQEPGMRLNYDTVLPKIAEELTGSKGEKVSLGEHKNARTAKNTDDVYMEKTYDTPQKAAQIAESLTKQYGRNAIDLVGNSVRITKTAVPDVNKWANNGWKEQQPNNLRTNLIFRNPDGTPKTDVSGMLYPLPKARTEPYSYFERRNQPEDESFYAKTGVAGRALLSKVAPEVEKLRAIAPKAAEGVTEFYAKNRAYRGQLEQTLADDLRSIRKAQDLKEFWYQDNPDYQRVLEYRDIAQDTGKEPFALTPVQKQINAAIDKNLKKSLDLREQFPDVGDIEGIARGTKGKEFYLPHVMSRKAAVELAENPKSAASQKYYQDFIKYRTEMRGQSADAADIDWNTLRSMFTLTEEGNIAAKFGAIDKAAGKGLPRSMREQNLMDRMARFNRRFARRVAYHEAIQRNEEASKELFGKKEGVSSTEVGRNIVEDMFGIREHTEALRSALSGTVRALMLGPLTGAKDVVSGQVLGLQHMELNQVLPAKIESLQQWKRNYKKAIETGVVRSNIGGLESGEGGLKQIHNILGRSRDIINLVQGRQLLETTARVLNYGEGRFLAMDALNRLREGNLTSQTRGFLDDFVKDWKNYKKGEVPETVLDEAAAKYVESVQGTYDYRGLPAVAMKGTLSPYLSLARWNVEKFNNFTKHVVTPAMKGNYKPLLMATLGVFIGGTAVNALVEEVTGRKERTPKWNEIAESKEQGELLAYKLAALASLSGYAGMMGDLVKSGMDWKNKNRVQTWNNPLIDAFGTGIEDTGFLVDAIAQGDLPAVTDVLHMLAQDYVQAYRIALPHVSEEKAAELDDTNKRRDLRVYQMGEGQELSKASTQRPNPLIQQQERQFKKTQDLQEAVTLLPEVIDKAIEKSKDEAGNINPEELKKNLSALRRNSYQTVPSPETSPIETSKYLDFLGRTQGKDTASQRLEDYMRRNAINKAKSSLIPTL